MKLCIVIIALFLFVLSSNAQTERIWPYMYDKSAYSYNQTSNVFGVHVHNLPVSEGNEFELDFDIKNVDLNRKIIDPETPSADFVRLIISTQWWITEKDSTNPAVRVRWF